MRETHHIPVERAKQLFDFDPETGIISRKVSRKRWKSGEVVGYKATGGLGVSFDRQHYKAHRVAWVLHYGVNPSGEIDHINGNPHDNRICNLRDVDRSTNEQNKIRAQSNNSSCGLRGVTFDKQRKKWRARVTVRRAVLHSSFHETPEAAHSAYVEAKRLFHSAPIMFAA